MKKFLAIVMCLAMALSMMTVVSFAAGFDSVIVDATNNVKVGDTVTVTISIPANDGASKGTLELAYDNTKLRALDVQPGDLVADASPMPNPEKSENTVFLSWTSTAPANFTAGGEVMIATFEAIAAGEATFSFAKVDIRKNFTKLCTNTSTTKTITIKGDEPVAPSAAIVDVPTEEGSSLKVITVTGTATQFGIKYTGAGEYNNVEFPSKAPAGTKTAAVKVVGLTGDFVGYAR